MMRMCRTIATVCVFPALLIQNAAAGQRRSLRRDAQALYSGTGSVRSDAARRLVKAGKASIPLLVRVVCDQSTPNFGLAWPSAAKALGELKTAAGASCLVQLLGVGDVTLSIFKPEKVMAEHDPAFAALVQIGEPAVPAIARSLANVGLDKAYLALRVLRVINTPESKAAADTYTKQLENELHLAEQVLSDFSYGPGLKR